MNRNFLKVIVLIMCIKKLFGICNVYVKKWNLVGIWIRSYGKKNCEFLFWFDLNLFLV